MLRTAMGDAIAAALDDPNVIEVLLNPDGSLWLDRLREGRAPTGLSLTAADAERIIRLVAAHSARRSPCRRADSLGRIAGHGRALRRRPSAGGSRSPAFAIRKRAAGVIRLDQYVVDRVITPSQAALLRAAVHERLNILIAGATSTGKTTLANALLEEIASTGDRVILLEDTVELQCVADDHVPLRTRPWRGLHGRTGSLDVTASSRPHRRR